MLSALGRLTRAGDLTVEEVDARLRELVALRLSAALDVELADQRAARVLTTDARLARRTGLAELAGAAADPPAR